MNEKKKNIINLTHSLVASFFSYNYIQYQGDLLKLIIFSLSFTYFLLDTWYIRNKDYLDIIHHILSCLVMISFYFDYYTFVYLVPSYLSLAIILKNISCFCICQKYANIYDVKQNIVVLQKM